ncbi:MAG: CinA family protein [Myxococcaceae bacterium]|nr:CinA family protein [Myxococcaceae bacterium]MCI0669761.1 CinA family protein [Myxococcaceae bacterium]
MFAESLLQQAEEVLAACRRAGLRVATAESCTGGLVSACLTAIAGSSDVVERGFVTYSNEAKMELLGVPEQLLAAHGAVSAEMAAALAEGAMARSRADLTLSVTGIAGPGGGTPTKPVGLVFLATARRGQPTRVERTVFPGDRGAVREASVRRALALLLARAGSP